MLDEHAGEYRVAAPVGIREAVKGFLTQSRGVDRQHAFRRLLHVETARVPERPRADPREWIVSTGVDHHQGDARTLVPDTGDELGLDHRAGLDEKLVAGAEFRDIRRNQVVAADDGMHAVEVALSSRPDLVLLDLELPKLDGLSVTRELRLHPTLTEVPIIILSGHDPSRFQQAALEAGCDDYLLKPIDFDRMQELLDRMIDGGRRPRSLIKSA